MKCAHCQEDFNPPEKPYVSKQAAMEGTYHWKCFIEACRNRIPVGIGAITVPGLGGADEESSSKRSTADLQEA
ncbi:MAG: hypothetical protein ABIE92_12435 [bacterium]